MSGNSAFGPITKEDIRVGYIDPILGYISDVNICDANSYAQKNPGTTFIFVDGDNAVRLLNINGVNRLNPNDLLRSKKCDGLQAPRRCDVPPIIQFIGGEGVGARANPIIGADGSLLAIDIIDGGRGYKYPPLVKIIDACNIGSGAVANAELGLVPIIPRNNLEKEIYELCTPTDQPIIKNYGSDGTDNGSWNPNKYIDNSLGGTVVDTGGLGTGAGAGGLGTGAGTGGLGTGAGAGGLGTGTGVGGLGGVITKVTVTEPGNGYTPPSTQSSEGYPVALQLTEIIITNPGINYNPTVDTIKIIPDNGTKISYTSDPFGVINKVIVDTPGIGFTEYPIIYMDTETGINFSAVPVFSVIRSPIPVTGIATEKILQVTDLVGITQTGYVDGKPYYGSVYYENNIRYAGNYKTTGQSIQVYDTLQESINRQSTTPPSAIQKTGSDIQSNNQNLNIPGTIQNTTNQ
jgi:hypothetical protein